MRELPEDWNKQFHFVRIRNIPEKFIEKLFPKEEFVGYMWPTNNWVEVHCFEKKEIKTEFKIYEQNCTVNIETEMSGHMVPLPHQMMKLFKSENTYFYHRKKSFIIPRNDVLFGSSNIIYCNPTKEDVKRWKEWHHDDKPLTFFEGDEKEWYFGETHQGQLFVRKIDDNSLGPLEHADDN